MATACKVRCPQCGDVLVPVSALVIDDEDNVYRFTCPTHQGAVDKPLTDDIRSILRNVSVPTVEEMVSVFASLLENDGNIVSGFGLLDA